MSKFVTKSMYELMTGWKPSERADRQKLNEKKRTKMNWTKKRKNERQD